MEKLASRHAITELMSWISLMENIIKEDQDKIVGAVGSEVVQDFLQKYKVQKGLFLLIAKTSGHAKMCSICYNAKSPLTGFNCLPSLFLLISSSTFRFCLLSFVFHRVSVLI